MGIFDKPLLKGYLLFFIGMTFLYNNYPRSSIVFQSIAIVYFVVSIVKNLKRLRNK